MDKETSWINLINIASVNKVGYKIAHILYKIEKQTVLIYDIASEKLH